MKTPFLGSAYTSRSRNLAAHRCINLYAEVVETREGKEVGGFYSTPGQILLTAAGIGPHRGAHAIDGGLLYVVSGNALYSVNNAWTATLLGNLQTNTGSVQMIDNGTQLAVFDGVAGYLWDGAAFSQISLPFSGPYAASYQDGFGLVTSIGIQTWYQSNYKDLSTWQALNFGNSDSQPGPLQAIVEKNREQWLMTQSYTEVWVNGGTSGFAFQRLQGVFLEVGCAATYSVAKLGDSLVWLGSSKRGRGIVYRSRGYQAEPISTHAIDYAIEGYSTISDAIGFAYEQGGHRFYVLTFPTAGVTWCWDEKTGLWHQRAGFSQGQFTRFVANTYAFFNGRHVIGDYSSGNLYALDLETYTDNGQPRKWLRSWRALQKPVNEPVTFDSLHVDMEAGITAAAGTNPQVMLRWSDNGGNSWSNERLCSAGVTGATAQRVRWTRLGQTRTNTGLDRIFEISSSDPLRAALIGADIEVN